MLEQDAGAADALRAPPLAGSGSPTHDVLLVDLPDGLVRRPGDLVALGSSLLGIAAVLVLTAYAPRTTEAVTGDVGSAAGVVRAVVQVPLTALEGALILLVPTVVLVAALIRRAVRTAAGMVLAAVVAVLVAGVLLRPAAPLAFVQGALGTPAAPDAEDTGASPYVAGLTALLTVAGGGTRTRRVPWAMLWVATGLSVIEGRQTPAGAVVMILLGHAVGLLVRYVLGARSDRAAGAALVRGVLRAGLVPVRIVRRTAGPDQVRAVAWRVRTDAPAGYTGRSPPYAGPGRPGDVVVVDRDVDPVAAQAAAGVLNDLSDRARHYAVWDGAGGRFDMAVLDGDRQVLDYLGGLWDVVRVRGLRQSHGATLGERARHAGLMRLWAPVAGVRTPALVGLSGARDSVIMVSTHVPGLRPVAEVVARPGDDAVLDDIWRQVLGAHDHGLSHGTLDRAAVQVDQDGQVWLLHWDDGETLASELARRVDLAQILVLLALHAGPDRALRSAARALPREALAALTPFVQPAVLPPTTGRGSRRLLDHLRRQLADLVPAAPAVPARLSRFSLRTILLVVVGGVAVWLLMGSLGSDDLVATVSGARPGWMVVSFLLGIVTYLGSALGLVAFSPERLGFWRTTAVQLAASVIALVVPAGVGPAGLNLRFLQRRRVPVPVAVATVGLTQLMQFLTTVVLLATVALGTGSIGTLRTPSPVFAVVAVGTVGAVAAALAVPPVRRWVARRVAPTLAQIRPRLLWLAGHPGRIGLGALGGVVLSAGYIAAFGAALAAFGHYLPPATLAITYLGASAAGSLIPSPGGIGPVELALTGGLTLAGVPYGAALSTALLFRLLTFWAPVPLGWLAMRLLGRRGEI
ncbi:lysylphosphatidylglycerol synthase transmembrane domain-containing protein [Georgenia yuyongxinii]|uniref:Flippase-like domain-containing protein n=1 Tax=Georgenia yuyongxinii TaxID=2589797 RepID=A0A552WKQ3_9MICO|nr:lysylphosphatidylglycerol synthase transmembrane domain-containing protein [Georgenia yuyongxinii]TRW43365.1 flippase-like domain-containing protein [Georgenia yuyongxinii]